VTDKWRRFMKGQIQLARLFFDEAEKGVAHLDSASRWPVCEPRNSAFNYAYNLNLQENCCFY